MFYAQQEAIDALLQLTRTLVAQQPETECDFVADDKVKTDEDFKQLDEKLDKWCINSDYSCYVLTRSMLRPLVVP